MSVLSEEVAKLQGAIASLAHKAKLAELAINDNKKKDQIIQSNAQKLAQASEDRGTAQKIIQNMNERLNKMTDRIHQLEQALREARAQIPEPVTEEATPA